MAPGRKRKLRLIAALTAVVVLAAALVYTSFSASSETRSPSDLLASAEPGETYELTGRVEPGYVRRGGTLHFRVRDRRGGGSVPVRYAGVVPDPFQGRPRGDRRGSQGGPGIPGRARLARDQVPVQVHEEGELSSDPASPRESGRDARGRRPLPLRGAVGRIQPVGAAGGWGRATGERRRAPAAAAQVDDERHQVGRQAEALVVRQGQDGRAEAVHQRVLDLLLGPAAPDLAPDERALALGHRRVGEVERRLRTRGT